MNLKDACRVVGFSALLLSENLLSHASIRAEVPHVFTAGSPAVAQQVNENFADLDSRTTDLRDLSCGPANIHSLSYSAKPSSIGDEIIVENDTYRMVKVPFVEFATGTRYTITLPARLNSNGDVFLNMSMSHSRGDPFCGATTVAGFPAATYISDYRNMLLANTGSYNSSSTYSVHAAVVLMINETTLQVSFQVESREQEQLVAIGDYDFSDDLDTGLMVHRSDLILAADDLIDYISIQAEP